MGRSEYHWNRWQLGFWQDIGGYGDREVSESPLGRHSRNGTVHIVGLQRW